MQDTAPPEPLDYELDIFGQSDILQVYTQLTLFYPVPDESRHPFILNTLNQGLERLSTAFPWIAGQVVKEGPEQTFKIRPLERTPRLVVNDLRDVPSSPTMASLRQTGFPMSMLDEAVIAPRRTLPGCPEEPPGDPRPVFALQANFVAGGLLLTFVSEHRAMDIMGQAAVMNLLSKACSGEPFTHDELATGNMLRRNLIPLLDDSYQPGPEIQHQIAKPPLSEENSESQSPPPASWAYFAFSTASLAALKVLATQTIPDKSRFISTDDAVSALIWQCVMRARLPRLNPDEKATFARAVDVRRHLNIPDTYPGVTQNMTYHALSPKEATEQSLGSLAAHLRAAVDPATSHLAEDTRALATLISRKENVSFTATIDASKDLMLSSWAKVDCSGMEFGLGLGSPEGVRRPRFQPFEGLMYLMPRAANGEIAAAISLRDEDMQRLRNDAVFMEYARYVG